MPSTGRIVAFSLGAWIASHAAVFAQAGLQINTKCSQQIIVAPNATLKQENVTINCGEGADPRTALKINYYWLDALSASLLLAGRNEGRLRDLLGADPVVLTNEVTQAFEELQTRFGSTIGTHSRFLEYHHYFTTHIDGVQKSKREYKTLVRSFRTSGFANLRVFDGMSPIYWPDVAAYRQMKTTPAFPEGYRHYTRDLPHSLEALAASKGLTDPEINEIVNYAFVSRVFHRPMPVAEFASYRAKLLEMKAAAEQGLDASAPALPNEKFDGTDETVRKIEKERINKLPALANNKAIAALQFLAREGMPADFVTAYGVYEDHAGDPQMWSILVLPRRPYLQIAVIENTAKTPTDYSLSEFVFSRDRETRLRVPAAGPSETRSVAFPPARLRHRERVVVPLAIEFREHRKIGDEHRQESLLPHEPTFTLLKKSLERVPQASLRARGNDGKPRPDMAAKPKSLFMTADPPPKIEPIYIFGPRYALKSVKLEGLDIPIRTAQPVGIYKVAGYDSGSCPILYYRTRGSDEWYKVGNILRHAAGRSQATSETYRLPSDVSEIALVEEEPERTQILDLTISASKAGQSRDIMIAGNTFALDVGESWTAVVPPVADDEFVAVTVTGYYVPYSWKIQAAVTRNP